jgi:La-related protein 7
VDPSGGSVRRLAPLPASDPLEIGSRTVVAENLPCGGADGAPTAASLDALFAKAGRVRMLRVCHPTSSGATGGRSTLQSAAAEDPWGALNVVSTQTHALVEYETRGEALAAVAQLNDGTNWRTGLRVRLVRREGPAFARSKGPEPAPAKGAAEGGIASAAEGAEAAEAAEGWAAAAGEAGGEGSGVAKAHKAPGAKGKKEKPPKRDYAAWASAGAHRETQQRERAAAAAAAEAWGPDAPGDAAAAPPAAASSAEPASSDGAVRPVRRFAPPSGAAAAAPGGGPAVREAAMPDGTRGFTRGRGRPLPSPFAA